MARVVAVVNELVSSLAAMVFGDLPAVELVEAVPEEIVAVTVSTVVVPIVAAASTHAAGISLVVEEQFARRELCDHCEYAARCTTQAVTPML